MMIGGVASAHEPSVDVIKENIHFCESVYTYEGDLLISNFGSDTPNPRDDENKGYILRYHGGNMETLIPADGRLHKPTAMAVDKDFLYVCDADKLKIFDMSNLDTAPRIINFAADDKVVNDVALYESKLYLTITNTGRIYTVDISDSQNIGEPKLWLELPGPNGIAIRKNIVYVVSIPVDYATITPDNIIYRITNLENPKVERFVDISALYDGVAISENGKTIYVTDWKTSSLSAINVKTKAQKTLYHEVGIGPADLAVANNKIYLPDLLNSRVIILPTNL